MNKVAVFGNAGGGKSTLSKRLAELTGLPLVPLDRMKYRPGGNEVPHAEFKVVHDALLSGFALKRNPSNPKWVVKFLPRPKGGARISQLNFLKLI